MRKVIALFYVIIMTECLLATDTLRVNMSEMLADYPVDADGKWMGTYDGELTTIDNDIFSFSHMMYVPGGASNTAKSYWDGFTLCNSGDTKNYGMSGSSDGWIKHQWGCMAGGGIDSTGAVVHGAPYLVAYWAFANEANNEHSVSINFSDGITHRPLGAWICNHPWPYYGNMNSDGFAHGFATNGDYFRLIAHGLDEDGKEVGNPVVLYLAQFHGDTLDQRADWMWMDLSSFGQVNGVYFTMESTDSSPTLGPNTAVYFCLGGFEALEHVDEVARPTGVTATALDENTVQLTWNRVEEADRYVVYVDSVLQDTVYGRKNTSYTVSGLTCYTTYKFSVQAVSEFGEVSQWGSDIIRMPDLTAPTMPANLVAVAHDYSIDITWDASTDNVGVDRYYIYLEGAVDGRTNKTSYEVADLGKDTEYSISVEARDAAGNRSEKAQIVVRTGNSATGVHASTSTAATRKLIVNGQLYIQRESAVYNSMGQSVQ